MEPTLLQDFRVAQLAVIGASKHKDIEELSLDGIDRVSLGDIIEISGIKLRKDFVVISVCDCESLMPISNLSDVVIKFIISILKSKSLDMANKDVYVKAC